MIEMPSTTSTSSDSDTAAMTREPAFATVRTSALRPSAAIATIVRFDDTSRVGATQLAGTTPAARNAASARKPTMNHGTSVGERRRSAKLVVLAQREEQHHGTEHQHANQLDERRHLAGQRAHRKRRRQHLRHGVHRQPASTPY